MSAPIFFAPLRVPLTDARTGLMSREWYLFFQAMFLRIGGTQSFTPDDLQIMGDVNDATDDGSDIRASAADLERAVSLDEPSIPTDLGELQMLSAAFVEDPVPIAGKPTAKVGPTVVNGTAMTFMPSDAAPPIDLTATFPWTGIHTFTYSNAGSARITITNSNAGAAALMIIELVNNAGNSLQAFTRSSAAGTPNEGVIQMNAGPLTITAVGGNLLTLGSDTKITGKSGFNGTAPIAKPTATGSRAANAALASLLTALASYGLITDSTTI